MLVYFGLDLGSISYALTQAAAAQGVAAAAAREHTVATTARFPDMPLRDSPWFQLQKMVEKVGRSIWCSTRSASTASASSTKVSPPS